MGSSELGRVRGARPQRRGGEGGRGRVGGHRRDATLLGMLLILFVACRGQAPRFLTFPDPSLPRGTRGQFGALTGVPQVIRRGGDSSSGGRKQAKLATHCSDGGFTPAAKAVVCLKVRIIIFCFLIDQLLYREKKKKKKKKKVLALIPLL